MRNLRKGLLGVAGVSLLPSLASASGAQGGACVGVWTAVGLAMLPPEAITDFARDGLLGGSGDGSEK